MITVAALFHILVLIIIAGLIFGLLVWLVNYIGLPAPFDKVARVVLAVFAVLFLIGILLGLAGHPVIIWR